MPSGGSQEDDRGVSRAGRPARFSVSSWAGGRARADLDKHTARAEKLRSRARVHDQPIHWVGLIGQSVDFSFGGRMGNAHDMEFELVARLTCSRFTYSAWAS